MNGIQTGTSVSLAAADAKRASVLLGGLDTAIKNAALAAIKAGLEGRKSEIFTANAADMADAEREGLATPLRKRLKFDDAKLDESLQGLVSLIGLPDPVGRILASRELDTGLLLRRVSCPIGVIGMIFESRPDALVQIASLCLKSGNSVLLKGGREAAATNRILATIVDEGALSAGVPAGWLFLLETREEAAAMLGLHGTIDLIVPRGSNEFVRHIMKNTAIPVLGHADGVCHQYVHEDADLDMAVSLVVDSKTQYPAVCNAMETLLVHAAAAPAFLPRLVEALTARQVRLKGCPRTRTFIECEPAGEQDWKTEYLDCAMNIRVVESLEAAIEHINSYGSHHTDGIVTRSREAAERFMGQVDSADVFWNASTRFSDGYRYGLGAEVGVSTGKLHARGPVGLEGLLTYKWKLYGEGHIVADYAEGRKRFTHRRSS